MKETESENDFEPMHRRDITLQDGRYMIFYTFGNGTDGKEQGDDPGEDV